MPKDELTITVNYAGQLAGEAGASDESVEVAPNTLVSDLLRLVALRHGGKFQQLLFDENDALRRALIVSVDDDQVMEPEKLALTRDHDVFLMTPIAGG